MLYITTNIIYIYIYKDCVFCVFFDEVHVECPNYTKIYTLLIIVFIITCMLVIKVLQFIKVS